MLRLLTNSGRRPRWNRLDTTKRLRKWKNAGNKLKNRKSRWLEGSWSARCKKDRATEARFYWLTA
jgi:hypothetical protein